MIIHNELNKNIEEIKKARTIKLFISSTFRDMQNERDELIKHRFVQLRRECEERGIIWSEVDLRWGVTNEQKSDGQVLPICLAEIDNCLPFFIGILGERYGWIPDIDEQLLIQYPWLEEYQNKSVTELEMVYGGLLQNNYAMFYFRDPAYLNQIEPNQLANYKETLDDTILTEQELQRRQQSLQVLKQRILSSDCKVHENFQDSKALGQLVYDDMKAIIDEWFPEDEVPDLLQKEMNEHIRYSKVRSNFSVGREKYLAEISHYVSHDGDSPLFIHGVSGVGKSTLLSKWYQDYAFDLQNEGTYVIGHFIGATAQGADSLFIVRRIILELNRAFDLQMDVPTDYAGLSEQFARALGLAGEKGKIVILLDSIDQLILTDRLQGDRPLWLPEKTAHNVRLVISTTTESKSTELFKTYGWQSIELKALLRSEQPQFITSYLTMYSKALEEGLITHILDHPLAGNPLFLMTLLEEIRVDGREDIEAVILHYIESATIEELFIKKIKRLEKDYEQDRPHLVKDVLALLWVSRNGLSEMEIREILGEGGILSSAIWSPFYLAMNSNLVNNGGLVCLFHTYLRSAVKSLYDLGDIQVERQYRQQLVHYFNQKNRYESKRVQSELPRQLYKLGAWSELYELLADLDFVALLWEENQDFVQICWTAIESNTDPSLKKFTQRLTILTAYETLLEHPEQFEESQVQLVQQICKRGHLEQCMALSQYLSRYYESESNIEGQLHSLESMAKLSQEVGHYQKALQLYEELYTLAIQYDSSYYLQLSLGGQADIYQSFDNPGKALQLLEQQHQICLKQENPYSLQKCLKNLALVQHKLFNIEEAFALQRAAEKICLALGSQYEIQEAYVIKAHIYSSKKWHTEALDILKEQQEICIRHGFASDEIKCLLGQIKVMRQLKKPGLYKRKDFISLIDRADFLARKLSNEKLLQQVHHSRTIIYLDYKENVWAKKSIQMQLEICERLQMMNEWQMGLGLSSKIHANALDFTEALADIEKQTNICRTYGYDFGLQYALNNKSRMLSQQGQFFEAVKCIDEQIDICTRTNNELGLISSYKLKSDSCRSLGRIDEAFHYLFEMKRLAEKNQAFGKYNQASYELSRLYMNQGNFAEALELLNQRKRDYELYKADELIEGLKETCRKALNNEPYENNTRYTDFYAMSDLELQVLQFIATVSSISSKKIEGQMIEAGHEVTKQELVDSECLDSLLKKNLIKKNKKNYSITDLAKYRLEQLTGIVYEVIDATNVKNTSDLFQKFTQELQLYLNDGHYQQGDTQLHLTMHGKERTIFIVMDETISEFNSFLDEQYEAGREIYFMSGTKSYLHEMAVVHFYKWVKSRFGKIQHASGLMKVHIAYITLYLLREKEQIIWKEIVF